MITVRNGFRYDAEAKGFVRNTQFDIPSALDIDIDAEGHYLMPGITDMHTHITPSYAKYYLLAGITNVRSFSGANEFYGTRAPEIYAADRDTGGAHDDMNAIEAAESGVKYLEHASGILQCVYDDYVPGDFEAMFKSQTVAFDDARLNSVLRTLKSYDVALVPRLALYRKNALGKITVPDDDLVDAMRSDSAVMLEARFELKDAERTANFKRFAEWEYAMMKIITRRYMEMGGAVYIGTGAPAGFWNYPGVSMIEELEIFNELGLPAGDVLHKAIVEPQSVTRHHENYVLLEANPLESFRNLTRVAGVILNGKYLSYDLLSSER